MKFCKPYGTIAVLLLLGQVFISCSKKDASPAPVPVPQPVNFSVLSWSINNQVAQNNAYNIPVKPALRLGFPTAINRSTIDAISLTEADGAPVKLVVGFDRSDSTVIVSPQMPLQHLAKYTLTVSTSLKAVNGGRLISPQAISFLTSMDSSRKFPLITDDSLLTLVQKQTFKYFWDFAHPVSGLARERNTSGDVVTSGGSGFGIMALVTAIHRGFITRTQGLQRMQTIVSFLKNTAQTFKGAYPHWLHGGTGEARPFSAQDNGADLVETAFLLQGLLTARQYFTGADAAETGLRNDINSIWHRVDWAWFRKGGENTLYWHWSPTYDWAMNVPIKGWHEGMITYILAAASPTHAIPKIVYDNGWASNGGIRNGKAYYGIPLPLGPDFGGPLFLSHYSFLGIDPRGLSDAYAVSYLAQNQAHARINHQHSISNPKGFYGYSDSTWGLTASDTPAGYAASSPTNDGGVIAPTAALASFPYTPAESMKALRFFYYVLGDKIWKEYGFVDAFSLQNAWFANSFLAIDQGPVIVMIENYRSGLLWELLMSAPEIKSGMKALGFTSPHF